MIIVNTIYLLFLNKVKGSSMDLNKVNIIIVGYVVFMMSWGAIISLMDQKLYGQVIVYMVNVIACSVIYYLDNKALLYSYFISGSILFLGLIFFQQSRNVFIGHCINCIIFLLYAWLASRILYKNLYNDFKNKILVIEANKKLKSEIEENKIVHKELEKANKKLKELSLYDELTKVNNRRALTEFINSTFICDLQQQTPVSIIMMDIDEFKLYNDKYGHVKGDEVLRKIATQLNEVVRDSKDFIARYGGEEFICISLGTDEKEIYEIANKIREKVYNLKIINENSEFSNYVTLSLGTATVIPHNTNSIYECIKNADTALYKAKTEGKNTVRNYNTVI
jgi:diguanylate cyclase (GGDEF) domain